MPLNKAQAQAVNSNSKVILCVASAGTGKTRVLTARTARLLKEDRISPLNILCLTFTRKAAGEMRERLGTMLPENVVRKLRIGTFHSFCFEIIKQWGELAGYRKNVSIYDEIDQKDILEAIINDFGFKTNPRAVLAARKEEQQDADVKCVLDEYKSILRQYNALDYDMLVDTALELLGMPQVLEYYRNRFRHILIDEYQDIDPYQYELHRILQPDSLFVVGDNDQAVYGWRSADMRILLDFMEKFPKAEKIILEDNYRSQPGIVEFANRVIEKNKNRFEKKMVAYRDGRLEPVINPGFEGVFEEGQFVLAEVNFLRSAFRHDYREIAILARTNRQLIEFEAWLKTTDLPCVRIGSKQDLWKREEIRLCANLLKILYNPWDNQALKSIFRTLQVDIPALKRLEWQARKQEKCLLEVVEHDIANVIRGHVDGHVFIPGRLKGERASDVLLNICNGLHVTDFYLQRMLTTRVERIKQAGTYLIEKGWSLEAFIEWYSMREATDELEDCGNEDKVRLMTVHMAKGLEFPVVFVIGLADGVFPSRRGDQEEERRLFYVACTRARDRLYLSCPLTDGNGKELKPSTFLTGG